MQISAVIPTCNRKERLLLLLNCLDKSGFQLHEVIIVDSGKDRLSPSDISAFSNLHIQCVSSERSVCIQRNTGIRIAQSPWIFLCDDDVEPPVDYLQHLAAHVDVHPEAGAVSGLFLQKANGAWTDKYSIRSTAVLLWRTIFKLSIWGEINCDNNFISRPLKDQYRRKGNYISRSGWPVITDFSGEYFVTPLYSLGASLVRKEWLVRSGFDEVLDAHGIGEHYGVIAGFPCKTVHVLNTTFVYHQHEEANRLQTSLQYYRRSLALDYFRQTKKQLNIKKFWLLWSLLGNLLTFIFKGKGTMIKATLKSMLYIAPGRNPYCIGAAASKKVVEPVF